MRKENAKFMGFIAKALENVVLQMYLVQEKSLIKKRR